MIALWQHPRARSTRASVAAAGAVIALACGNAAPGLADTVSPARQWAAEAIRRLDLQSELPRRAEDPDPVRLKLPPELVWIPVIGGLGVLLFYLGTMLRHWRLGGVADWEASGAEPQGGAASTSAAQAALAADALAREGRFDEAMHLALLGGLAAIRERIGDEIADSLTSREIVRSRRLSDAARACLREIVGRVERSHFGRYPASSGDYAACRTALDGLLQVLHREPAA